jgi:hypothetical protein
MPEQKRSSRTKGVPHHPLVEALAPDPGRPPTKATRLFGYPGAAADSKSTRLWLDPELSSYVDIPDDAILHHRTLDDEEGTILWVDPAATLTHSAPREQEVQAEFLGGAIAQGNLAGAAPSGVPPQIDISVQVICQTGGFTSRLWECWYTRNLICRYSRLPACRAALDVPVAEVDRQRATLGFDCNSLYPPCNTDWRGCRPFRTLICPTPHCIPEKISAVGGCEPETGWGVTPVVDQVGPFRPQQ